VIKLTTKAEKMAAAAVSVAVATADTGIRVEDRANLEILGIPAYRLQVEAKGDPVEVGKRMTYQITVTNTGSLPANKVVIKATIPPELKLVTVSGPSKETIAGQVVTFAAVDGIQPKQAVTYVLEVEGVKPGDVRFRAELLGETLQQPVIKEASTTVFDPTAGTNGARPK
jgi:uncharacterized repeat protein (TIGR01451 family)